MTKWPKAPIKRVIVASTPMAKNNHPANDPQSSSKTNPSYLTKQAGINADGPPLLSSPSDIAVNAVLSVNAIKHELAASIAEQELFKQEAEQAEEDLCCHKDETITVVYQ